MDKIDGILQRYTAQGNDTKDKVCGVSFVVTDCNGIIYSGSAGRIAPEPSSAPFTDRSFTWVASLTKLVTATACLQLVDQGKLTLDQDLRPIVPYLAKVQILEGFDDDNKPIMRDNTKPITLRQLVTHTAGFSYEFIDQALQKWARQKGRRVWLLERSLEEISTPLRFAPGESWVYGVGLDWAGQTLEAVTGQTLGEYTTERIFRPLGMHDSGFRIDNRGGAGIAARTAGRTVRAAMRDQRTGELGPTAEAWSLPPAEHELDTGGSGLSTTARDYAALLRGILVARGGGGGGGTSASPSPVLSAATTADMFRPQLDENQARIMSTIAFHPQVVRTFVPEFEPGPVPLSHGLGGVVNLADVAGKRRAGSMAWSGVHNSRWWIDPKTGIAAVLMVNIRPHGDAVVAKLYNELELATYAAVGSRGGNL